MGSSLGTAIFINILGTVLSYLLTFTTILDFVKPTAVSQPVLYFIFTLPFLIAIIITYTFMQDQFMPSIFITLLIGITAYFALSYLMPTPVSS